MAGGKAGKDSGRQRFARLGVLRRGVCRAGLSGDKDTARRGLQRTGLYRIGLTGARSHNCPALRFVRA